MEGLYHRAHRLLLDPERTNGSRTRGTAAAAHGGEADFDTNMVIILAALLSALICALGINSIVRCALRCSRRFAAEEREAARGMKKSALRRIPVAVYGGSGVDIPATDCPICLGDFADGEKVRVLPKCHHGFHVGCIDTWLLSNSSCPTCRRSLLSPPSAAAEGSVGDGDGGVRRHWGGGTGTQQGGDVATSVDDVG